MLIAALIASLIVAVIRGGNLRRVVAVDVRGLWWYASGYLMQIPTFLGALNRYGDLRAWAYSTSFLFLLAGTLLDRGLAGMQWITLGLLLNGSVIAINGGKMPARVSPHAFPADAQVLTHMPMTDLTRVWFLGDIIRFPLLRGHYLLVSPGDLLIGLGVFLVVQGLLLKRGEPEGTS